MKGVIGMKLRLLAFRIVLILVACFSISYAESGVTGLVTNEFGYPIPGAFLYAVKAEKGRIGFYTTGPTRCMARTDLNGAYCFDIPMGYYSVTATTDSVRIPTRQSIVLVNEEYETLDLRLSVDPFEPGSVTGIVTDQNNRPLSGCNVLVNTFRAGALTNSQGEYIITGLPSGFHSIEANYHGMETVTIDSVLVSPNQECVYNFDTASGACIQDTTGGISGRITDEDGNPIVTGANVTVMIQDTHWGAHADSTGYYHIYNIEPGKYILTVRSMGYYENQSPSIVIISGEVVEYSFDSSTFHDDDSLGGPLRQQPNPEIVITVTDGRGTNETP